MRGRRLGQRNLTRDAPEHRFADANAAWRVIVGTLAPLCAALVFVQGLRWSGLAPERWHDLLDAAVGAAGFAGFTVAVTGAVLMRSQAFWRIGSVEDETAARLRPCRGYSPDGRSPPCC